MIDIDGSALLVILLIVVLVFLLDRLFFRPVVAVMEARDRQINGPKEEAARLIGQHDQMLASLQASLSHARRDGNDHKARVKEGAQKEGESVIEKTQAEAREFLDKQAGRLEEQARRARQELSAHIEALAQRIAGYFVRG